MPFQVSGWSLRLAVALLATTAVAPLHGAAAQEGEPPAVEGHQDQPSELAENDAPPLPDAPVATQGPQPDRPLLGPLMAGTPPADANWMPFVGSFPRWCSYLSTGCIHHDDSWAVDLGLTFNTPVHAAGSGVLRVVDRGCAPMGGDWCNAAAGNYVAIEHTSSDPDSPYWSRYLHLASIPAGLKTGQTITAGALVGFVGASGTGNGTVHLHYDETTPPPEHRLVYGWMLACHGDTPVQYPQILGYTSWPEVPSGTILRNDGYECLGGVTPRPPTPRTPLTIGGANGLATGDFDGDGRDDLAVGVPGEDGAGANSGMAIVSYGQPDRAWGSAVSLRQAAEMQGSNEAQDLVGASVAAGDLNCDGFDDLAAGAPGEDLDSSTGNAGAVNLAYGSPSGLVGSSGLLYQQQGRLTGTAAAGDLVGVSLAFGDFDGDGCDDLAIGAPGEDVGTSTDAGRVNVVHGSPSGTPGPAPDLVQGSTLAGMSETNDRLGTAMTVGDFNCDGVDDLAVGAPGEGVATGSSVRESAGAVYIVHGVTGTGLVGAKTVLYQEGGLAGTLEASDWLGSALAAGDFDGDACDDLVVGVAGEDLPAATGTGNATDTGAVDVAYGSPAGFPRSIVLYQLPQGLLPGTAETGDRLGSAVAVADIDCDGRDDLLIGVEGEGQPGLLDAGIALVVRGATGEGLTGSRSVLRQGRMLGDRAEREDKTGSALAAGDFDGDGCLDVAIAAPGESVGTNARAGAVSILFRGSGASRAVLHQGSGLPDVAEAGDFTGSPPASTLLALPLAD